MRLFATLASLKNIRHGARLVIVFKGVVTGRMFMKLLGRSV